MKRQHPLHLIVKSCFLFLCWSTPSSAYYQEPWGKDADLHSPFPDEAPPHRSLLTNTADAIIRFHQTIISPIDGPRSHFRPTSSRYMQLCMYRYGFLRGFIMGCDRLLRENNEEWVYPIISVGGQYFKFDPAFENKYEAR